MTTTPPDNAGLAERLEEHAFWCETDYRTGDAAIMREAAAALRPSVWMDISTAPKDAGRILGYGPDLGDRGDPGMATIYWTEPTLWHDMVSHPTVADAFQRVEITHPGYWSNDLMSPVEPTHWMPLPSAPTPPKAPTP